MLSQNSYNTIVAVIITLVFSLAFNGCGSSNSDQNKNRGENFDSGTIAPGETFSYTFDQEGTTEYYCKIHAPDMQGEVTVSSSAEAVQSDTVSMEGNQFKPSALTVAPNTKVVWVNNQDHDHRVVSGNPSSDSGDYGY